MSKTQRTLYDQLREEASLSKTTEQNTTRTILRWTIIVVAVIILTALLPGSGGEALQGTYDQTLLGTAWAQESVLADYSFAVPKTSYVLESERRKAIESAPIVVKLTPQTEQDIVVRIANAKKLVESEAQAWIQKNSSTIIRICNTPFVTTPLPDSSSSATTMIVVAPNGTTTLVDRTAATTTLALAQKLKSLLTSAPSGLQKQLETALQSIPAATLTFDASGTISEREKAENGVSTTMEIIRHGDFVIKKGQRIDETVLARLLAYRNAQFVRSEVQFNVFAIVGSFGHAIIIISLIVLYLFFLRPNSFESLGQLGTLCGLPVLCAFMGWLSVRLHPVLPIEYVIVVPALAMITTILYEARTALLVTLVMSIAVGAARGDDYGTIIVLFVGGTMGVYSARNIHSRTQIFTSIVAVFVGLVVAVIAIDLERSAPIQWMWPKIVMAGANAVISPLITFGIILAFERVFNVATDLRLEEYNNLNHELLRKLNEQAPGTYQHTLAVARLSEAAAQAIGANVLLVRVGAYFHDVGKIEKSEYFAENQIDIENKHDKLPPRKSAAIIRQHVQNGIELAASYRLPSRISQFVPMHHGTILIKHFYAVAIENAKTDGTTVDENDFRYPGPRPDSKETGIVMLADAAEAISRLVDTSQRAQIESAVDTIINDRLTDGQLSNTSLTMKDLALIKEAFVRNILGSTHQRVRYKDVQPPTSST